MNHLKGKTAIVTGAASGIGLAICDALVAEGMTVSMVDVNSELLDSVAARYGDRVLAIAADVSSAEQLEDASRATIDRFGALHVAVNNAGVLTFGPCWELTVEQWRSVLDVNLWGVIHGIRSFVPRIIASGQGGHVVNVASMAALLPIVGTGPYTASKHAVLGVSDVLRADIQAAGVPVGVSVVFPGLVQTGISPVGGDPSRTAANVVDAIRGDRNYVYCDDAFAAEVKQRLGDLVDARSQVIG